MAVAAMTLAPIAVAQDGSSAVDQYSPVCPNATASGECNPSAEGPGGPGGPGGADGRGGSGGGGAAGGGGSGPGSGGTPEFEALRERLQRSGALDAPGFSNLLKSFRGLEGENPAASIDGRTPSGTSAEAASSRGDGGGDPDRTGLLLIVLLLSTLAVTGLGVAFKRRRDGLAVRP